VVRARTVQRRQKSKGRTERTKKTRAEAPCKRLAAANGAINSAGTDTRCFYRLPGRTLQRLEWNAERDRTRETRAVHSSGDSV
jgi:hypothetical protein